MFYLHPGQCGSGSGADSRNTVSETAMPTYTHSFTHKCVTMLLVTVLPRRIHQYYFFGQNSVRHIPQWELRRTKVQN